MISVNKEFLMLNPPISFEDLFFITPLTIKQIFILGIDEYQHRVNLLTITSDDLKYSMYKKNQEFKKRKEFDKCIEIPDEIDPFENLINCCLDPRFLLDTKVALSTFIKEKVSINVAEKKIVIGDNIGVIDSHNFKNFQMILGLQNHIGDYLTLAYDETEEDLDQNPVRKTIREKQKIVKRLKAEKNAEEGAPLTLYGIFKAVIAFGLPREELLSSGVFYLQEMFDTFIKKERHDTQVLAMVQGAQIKNFKHWTQDSDE